MNSPIDATELFIENYNLKNDATAVFELWESAVGQLWPISFSRLQQVLAGPNAHHLVVRWGEQVIGFAATFTSERQQMQVGHLAALLIAPPQQRQGLGTQLHHAALLYLKSVGIHSVQLGSISPRFWCGVPVNLPIALTFFQAQGWSINPSEVKPVYDLVQDLRHYTTSARIDQRMLQEQITLFVANSENVAEVLAFEECEFPDWLPAYQHYAELGDYHDLLVARDSQQQVIGTLLLYSTHSHPQRTDLIWQALLGENAGAIGSVGVADAARGRGIGLALVARGSEILKEQGVHNCYIDWVALTDFYARLGYQKWRDYYVSWRLL